MSTHTGKRKKKTPASSATEKASAETSKTPAPQPVNVSDGIPDRAEVPSRWRLIAVLLIFAAWAAFLIYCLLAGRPT